MAGTTVTAPRPSASPRLLLRGDSPGNGGPFRQLHETSAPSAGPARSSRMVAQSSSLRLFSRQRRNRGTDSATHAHRVNAGRGTELAPVLPAELGGTVVSDEVADAGNV